MNRLDIVVFGSAAIVVAAGALLGFHIFFRYEYVHAGTVVTRVDRLTGGICVMPCLPTAPPTAPPPTQPPPSLEDREQRAIVQVQRDPAARRAAASAAGQAYEWSAVPAAQAVKNGSTFSDEEDSFAVCYCDRDGFGLRWEAHLRSAQTYYANDNTILRERYGARVRPAATSPALAVAHGSATEPDAAALVNAYYELWNRSDLRAMYMMLSERYRLEHPFAVWERQHAGVLRISVTTSETTEPMTVAVVVESTDRAGAGTVDEEYRGTWTLVREPSGLKLDRADLHQTR